MGEKNCWEREVVITELTKGRELMWQLQKHFDPMKQDVCQYLAVEILSSYDKALSLLNGTTLSGMNKGKQSINPAPSSSTAQLESPHLLDDSSTKCCDRPSNSSKRYKGVRQRNVGKWVAQIRNRNDGARLWLGTYENSCDAAVAYDAAALKLYGENAKLNFPHRYNKQAKNSRPMNNVGAYHSTSM